MIRRPSPLHDLWRGFKVLTIGLAWAIGILFILVGMIGLDLPGWPLFFLAGFFSCWCGWSISSSLTQEEILKKFEE